MPDISWQKNGVIISASAKYTFTGHNKRLKVKNPVKADEGTYSCHITNQPSLSAAKADAKLVVDGKFSNSNMAFGEKCYSRD